MRATTTPSSDAPSSVTSSTSSPIAVSVAASSSREACVGTCCRSQFSENFIGSRSSNRHAAGVTGIRKNGLRELAQEAHVVLEEAAQVVDAVTQHREALDAQAERETRVLLRIDAHVAEDVRM